MGFLGAVIFGVIMSILIGESACYYGIRFPDFISGRDTGNFTLLNAIIGIGAVQVTPDSINRESQFSLENRSGRILLQRSFQVYHGNKTASFNSSFVFNIQPQNGSSGEGLAFIIASDEYLPDNSYGQWLGLFNASTNGSSNSKLLAVEFDTRKSPGTNDPDGNHVGINVNNINSKNITSLDRINLTSRSDIQAWIKYDGDKKMLDVYVENKSELGRMPLRPLVSYFINLRDVLDAEAYFGFSASTGVGTELNCVKSWNFTILESKPSRNHMVLVIPLVIALVIALVITALIAATGIIVVLKNRHKSRAEAASISGALENIPGRPREFKYKDLKKATNNFSLAAKLGSGGFGTVYKGILPEENTVVAVKRIAKDSKQGKDEFISEISIINGLRQKNLVPLLGWCHEKGQLIMVYEYMPNGSLDKHIFNEDITGGFLDWEQRYSIVSGVAAALLYLHEECVQQVIHRDVKASNIMLDSDYKARLGDFGLARVIENNRRSLNVTDVAGTLGYIAPECFHTGQATAESDVFSFGAVALEVACGRPPRLRGREVAPDLVDWVWELYRENRLLEAVDSHLATAENPNANYEDDIKLLLVLGLACSNSNPGDRPTMREVTQILARTMFPPFVPPIRPPFIWPYLPSDTSSTSTSQNSTKNLRCSDNSFLQSDSPDGNREGRSFIVEVEDT